MHQQKIQEMFEKEDTFWWFAARRTMVQKILAKYVKKGATLLDAGCGAGLLTKMLDSRYRITAIDTDDTSIRLTKSRKPKATVLKVNIEHLLPFPAKTFDAVTLLDVLEHVDDHRALSNLSRVLKPGGVAIITVPAYPWLFSYWDILHQHKRRYTFADLSNILTKHHFGVMHHSYFNTLFFPFILMIRLAKSLLKHPENHSDCGEIPKRANSALLKIFQKETLLAVDHTIPFGLSLLVIARKSTTGETQP